MISKAWIRNDSDFQTVTRADDPSVKKFTSNYSSEGYTFLWKWLFGGGVCSIQVPVHYNGKYVK